VSWRYITDVLKIFDRSNKDILYLALGYLVGVLEIFDRCPGDI